MVLPEFFPYPVEPSLSDRPPQAKSDSKLEQRPPESEIELVKHLVAFFINSAHFLSSPLNETRKYLVRWRTGRKLNELSQPLELKTIRGDCKGIFDNCLRKIAERLETPLLYPDRLTDFYTRAEQTFLASLELSRRYQEEGQWIVALEKVETTSSWWTKYKSKENVKDNIVEFAESLYGCAHIHLREAEIWEDLFYQDHIDRRAKPAIGIMAAQHYVQSWFSDYSLGPQQVSLLERAIAILKTLGENDLILQIRSMLFQANNYIAMNTQGLTHEEKLAASLRNLSGNVIVIGFPDAERNARLQ